MRPSDTEYIGRERFGKRVSARGETQFVLQTLGVPPLVPYSSIGRCIGISTTAVGSTKVEHRA